MADMLRILPSPSDPDVPSLDLVSPGVAPGSPAVLVFPGGGYHRRAPHEGVEVARFLAGNGFATAVVQYRVVPHRHPAPLTDARRAMRLVRERAGEWNIDPSRVAVVGFSAGGHLAATLATRPDEDAGPGQISARPDALALAYPVISFVKHAHAGSMAALLGEGADPASRQALSAEFNVTRATPPTFLFHTADDPVVPVQNSLMFAGACAAHGVPVELHVFPNGRHGVGLAVGDAVLSAWPGLLVGWLRRVLGRG